MENPEHSRFIEDQHTQQEVTKWQWIGFVKKQKQQYYKEEEKETAAFLPCAREAKNGVKQLVSVRRSV